MTVLAIDQVLHPGVLADDHRDARDERLVLPRTGYVVEPGLYLPGAFGIRSSIDLFLAADGVHVTPEPPQTEIELIRK